jgi:c-di-GMP-binding flagellar brake protein YcgR
MIKERRLNQRSQVNWSAIIQLEDKTGFKANTIDISESGVLLSSKVKLNEKDKVMLYIMANVSGEITKIKTTAECRFFTEYCGNYNFGLRFLDISLHDRIFLSSYVNGTSFLTKNIPNMPSPSEVRHVSSQFN